MENIHFNHLKFSFEELQESKYISTILNLLKSEFGDTFSEFSFHIHSSDHQDRSPLPIILDNSKKNILIYLSDEFSTAPTYLSKYFDAIFKCYLPDENNTEQHLFPFPLGYVKETKELKVKTIDQRKLNVFFSGNLNENRIALYQELSSLAGITNKWNLRTIVTNKAIYTFNRRDLSNVFPNSYIVFTDGFKTGFHPSAFSKILYNSKIALCPKGFYSSETFRHYEALRAGCVVISEKLPDTHLYKESPIIQLENWKNLRPLIQKLLKDENYLEELHQKSLRWYNDVFSEQVVAKYMQDILKQL